MFFDKSLPLTVCSFQPWTARAEAPGCPPSGSLEAR
jgi:hypothetical protein